MSLTAVLCYYDCYFAIRMSQSRNSEKFTRTTVLVGGSNLWWGLEPPAPRWLRPWGHRSIAKVGAPIRAREKIFLGRTPQLFGSKSTISRFGERVRDGQYTVWSVYCLLFSYSRCPPCPAICKSGGHVPPCPMESAPLRTQRTQLTCSDSVRLSIWWSLTLSAAWLVNCTRDQCMSVETWVRGWVAVSTESKIYCNVVAVTYLTGNVLRSVHDAIYRP